MNDTETVEETPVKKNHADPLTIEERVARFLAARQTPAQRRRLKKKLHQEYGKAQAYRGAVKKARLKKLETLWLDAKLPVRKETVK